MAGLHSDPPVGGCFTGVVCGDDTMASVTVVFGLCHFCLVPVGFNKVLVRSFFIAAGSGRQRREHWATARAASPFTLSQPHWPVVVLIPGTLAGRSLCLWPTQVVVPMTLAPETGEVSWNSMGLWRVSFLAEVHSHSSKS
jgi:hypothetical protein